MVAVAPTHISFRGEQELVTITPKTVPNGTSPNLSGDAATTSELRPELPVSRVENQTDHLANLKATAHLAAEVAADSYHRARSSLESSIRSLQSAAIQSRAKKLSTLFPGKSIVLGEGTTLRLDEVKKYLDSDSSKIALVRHSLNEFREAELTQLSLTSEQQKKTAHELKLEVFKARGNSPRLREMANTIETLHSQQAENYRLRKALSSQQEFDPPTIDPDSVRKLADETEQALHQISAISKNDHPLQTSLVAAQKALGTIQSRKDRRGCLCQSEWSLPYRQGRRLYRMEICVMRSEANGNPTAWISKGSRGCDDDCRRWLNDSSYYRYCSTDLEQKKIQTELLRAKEGVSAAERYLARDKSELDKNYERLLNWNFE